MDCQCAIPMILRHGISDVGASGGVHGGHQWPSALNKIRPYSRYPSRFVQMDVGVSSDPILICLRRLPEMSLLAAKKAPGAPMGSSPFPVGDKVPGYFGGVDTSPTQLRKKQTNIGTRWVPNLHPSIQERPPLVPDGCHISLLQL